MGSVIDTTINQPYTFATFANDIAAPWRTDCMLSDKFLKNKPWSSLKEALYERN